jgi:hypothetical protein
MTEMLETYRLHPVPHALCHTSAADMCSMTLSRDGALGRWSGLWSVRSRTRVDWSGEGKKLERKKKQNQKFVGGGQNRSTQEDKGT